MKKKYLDFKPDSVIRIVPTFTGIEPTFRKYYIRKNKTMKHIIKIYKKDKFVGYVKSYRKHRNGCYRFERTKNIDNAIIYTSIIDCHLLKIKLLYSLDFLLYSYSYKFKSKKITAQEIRFSKLNMLKTKKIRTGILKNKIL